MLSPSQWRRSSGVERGNNFDGLRLAAATAVIFSHSFLLAEGRQDDEPLMRLTGGQSVLGVVGVFVFFVISGFLVTESWERTGAPLRFAMKRFLRIYPGFAACILALALWLGPAVTTLAPGDYFRAGGLYEFVAQNLVMNVDHNALPGVRFTGHGVGDIVDGPLWSLPCEVLMYALVLVLGMLRLLRLPVLAALLALGLACVVTDTAASSYFVGAAGWLLPFFVAGMILQKLRASPLLRDGRIALLALAGLVLAAAAGRFILLFPVFGAYLVIYAALNPRWKPFPAARFGDLSYGLYIYGWPVDQTLLYVSQGRLAWWQLFPLALAISAALAFISWHLVEKPALRLKPGAAPPARLA